MNAKSLLLLLLCGVCFCQTEAKTRKAIYIVMDGIPADYIERVHPETVFDIAKTGHYARACTGGEIGAYSQTPTVSAIGYTNMLTGTWMNKHNVNGNSNLKPNYNYPTIFRIAKDQKRDYKTAIFSSWTDNRTVLIGEGKPETKNVKIDYVFDGYDLDTVQYPKKPQELHVFDYDTRVCKEAAQCIRNNAPDLSWVYLWYTDSGYHLYGNGKFMDEYVNKTDRLIAQIWEAVKYREKNFDEEWLVIVTTDHGREESGHGHGGQSVRERTVWFSTNLKAVNAQFSRPILALTDINPTICAFMGFEEPRDIFWEQDGLSFYGKTDIYDLKTMPYDNTVTLEWSCDGSDAEAEVYIATTNEFNKGGKDNWIKAGSTKANAKHFAIDLSKYPASKFYKFVVVTPNNHITRWMMK